MEWTDEDNKDYKVNPTLWEVNPHDYEFNGSITAQIKIENQNIDSENFLLAAFEGDECVGVAKADKFPLNDLYVFGLMMYNNKENAKVDFKV